MTGRDKTRRYGAGRRCLFVVVPPHKNVFFGTKHVTHTTHTTKTRRMGRRGNGRERQRHVKPTNKKSDRCTRFRLFLSCFVAWLVSSFPPPVSQYSKHAKENSLLLPSPPVIRVFCLRATNPDRPTHSSYICMHLCVTPCCLWFSSTHPDLGLTGTSSALTL